MPLCRERCYLEDRNEPLCRERCYLEEGNEPLRRERRYLEDWTMPPAYSSVAVFRRLSPTESHHTSPSPTSHQSSRRSHPSLHTDFAGLGEVDYTAEEILGEGDAITMTFTPYLQGNLEAVVLHDVEAGVVCFLLCLALFLVVLGNGILDILFSEITLKGANAQ